MAEHWKHRATRCAVEGCERQRVKGHSTCAVVTHYRLGWPLHGSGPNKAIPAPAPATCRYCGIPGKTGLLCDDDHCRE